MMELGHFIGTQLCKDTGFLRACVCVCVCVRVCVRV